MEEIIQVTGEGVEDVWLKFKEDMIGATVEVMV